MLKIVTVAQMRALEAAADAAGVTYAEMMDRAGAAVAEVVQARIETLQGKTIVVLVGPGNNGGDGLVAGRLLAEAGATVKFYFLRPPAEDDPNVAKARAGEMFMADAENDQRWRVLKNVLRGADVLVDALFGTGVRLPLRDSAARLLQQVGRTLADGDRRPLRVAVDVPSGYDCDTGALDAKSIPADVTVTFGAAKVGQFSFPGAEALGDLVLADIGWPDDLPGLGDIPLDLMDAPTAAALLPSRPRSAHKGTFGTALVLAGSVNYTGAAYLSARAAYLSGAGLVTAGIPMSIHAALAGSLPEATWIILPSDLGVIAEGGVAVARKAVRKADALLLGPGWGTEKSTGAFLQGLLSGANENPRAAFGFRPAAGAGAEDRPGENDALPALVVDADGLKLLSELDGWPGLLPAPAVLTPHPGEMAILTGDPKDELQADRVGNARKYAAQWGHVVVLKGAFTVAAAPDGRVTVLPFATPALARAGTGDVLAGLIVGLLAQGLASYEAATTGAYIHGLAGELAARKIGAAASVLAGDVLEAIPAAFVAIGESRASRYSPV
ncbi:MAG: NAD(P)H-hydrate epimerase [Anaerolineales bacterium]